MKSSARILLIGLATCLFSCSTTNQIDCEELICTQEFRSVRVKFVDSEGHPVEVKDFSSVNLRTKKSLGFNNEPPSEYNRGVYIVANDSDLVNLSEKGDTISVSAVNPRNNRPIKETFVIAGGRCACHIHKISGPEEIRL